MQELARLDHRALMSVVGDDANTWLNGQLSNQVLDLSVGGTTYALVLARSGKIMADVFVFREAIDRFLLNVPRAQRDALLKHFDEFIIMEDVELQADDAATIAVLGSNSEAFPLPTGRTPAWDWLGDGGCSWLGEQTSLHGDVKWLEEPEWELARLRAWRPSYGVDFGDFTLPQEAGLEHRAVSFEKGCYYGQEAVVMLEHRGQVPKKLVRVVVESDHVPRWKTPIATSSGQSIGMLCSGAFDPELGFVRAFAYIKRQFLGTAEVLKTAGCDTKFWPSD